MNNEIATQLIIKGHDYVWIILIVLYTLIIFLILKLIYWTKLNKFNIKSFFIDISSDILFVILSKIFLKNIASIFDINIKYIAIIVLIITFIILPTIYLKYKRVALTYFDIKLRNYYWIYDISIIILTLAFMYYYKFSIWN
jgi:hypothetical protein